ncbi:S8 family peptidase [Aquimarina sediminis]|uniref:S8 family peptidase n=1 Tax=Aquimarina sediminis TaxID=2070536 RepID=UPI000CA053BB|nr:S8/S53 family peptidase [Aquimarina sediminis]
MKTSKVLIGICLLTLWGCSTDEGDFTEKDTNQSIEKNTSSVPTHEIIKNEIVIQYNRKNLSEEDKLFIVNQFETDYKFKITDRKTCDCDNDNLELWTVNLTNSKFVKIEETIMNLKGDEPKGGVEANLNFYFQIKNDPISGNQTSTLIEKTVAMNNDDAVNIAILDTGIDYDFFPEPFLYNSSNTSGCSNEISGWDFVNHDNDPRDDNGHGTIVTKIITNQLDRYNIPYEIMPVKAFDHNGRGSYWASVCGINHIAKKQDNFIVNTSFGFYKLTEQNIFKNIIDDASDRLLILASAGNLGIDTDIPGNEHYPSGYNSANVLTVGGYTIKDFFGAPIHGSPYVSGLSRAEGSNYGKLNIDALAPFDDHEVKLTTYPRNLNDPIVVFAEGTSFANAEVTARAAQLFNETNGTPLAVKKRTLDSGYKQLGLNGFIDEGKVIVRNIINSSNPIPVHYNNPSNPQ